MSLYVTQQQSVRLWVPLLGTIQPPAESNLPPSCVYLTNQQRMGREHFSHTDQQNNETFIFLFLSILESLAL